MSSHALDYIKREITEYLRQNPQDANELLSSVALGMTQYKQKVQEERKGQMQNCVGMLYSLIKKKSFSKIGLACVLPSLFITFPKAKITGHSGTDVEIQNRLIVACKQHLSENELRLLCLKLLREGIDSKEIIDDFEYIRVHCDIEDEYEDLILNVMDAVVGWCSPHRKLVA